MNDQVTMHSKQQLSMMQSFIKQYYYIKITIVIDIDVIRM